MNNLILAFDCSDVISKRSTMTYSEATLTLISGLLLTDDVPDDHEEDQQNEDSTETKDITSESITRIHLSALKEFITKNEKQFINQIITLCALAPHYSSYNDMMKKAIKNMFSLTSPHSEDFKNQIQKLASEAKQVFQAFASESPEKVKELEVKNLPKVKSNQVAGVNSLMSAFVFRNFHMYVMDAVPESFRTFVPSLCEDFLLDSALEILRNFKSIIDERFKKNLIYLTFEGNLEIITDIPSLNRLKMNRELYEAGEFNETHKEKLEIMYKGVSKTILNYEIYDQYPQEVDCLNLLILMVWNPEYAERCVKDGLIEKIFHLCCDCKTQKIPFIVDILIGDQIPPENRIEISLKAALLNSASVKALSKQEMLESLKPYILAYPQLFKKKFNELFTVSELPQANSTETKKSTKNHSLILKREFSYSKLEETGENISDYLKKSVRITGRTVVRELIKMIVQTSDKVWKDQFSDENDLAHYKMSETTYDLTTDLDGNFQLLSMILKKYPELKSYAAEEKISTQVFDMKSYLFTELAEPQETTFLDYAVHVLQTPAFPVHASVVTCFFERYTPAYTLKHGDEIITSNEWFAGMVIDKCLQALSAFAANADIEECKRHQLQFVYAQTIRNALRSEWVSSEYATKVNNKVISELEAIINVNLAHGRTLKDLFTLHEVVRIQTHVQIAQAYAQLDPMHAQENLPKNSREAIREEYHCLRSLLHFGRDYEKLDQYYSKTQADVLVDRDPVKGESEKLHAIRIESNENRRALLVRAIIEGKPLDYQYVFSHGTAYYAHCRTVIDKDSLALLEPKGTSKDPFTKLFHASRCEADYKKDSTEATVLMKITSYLSDVKSTHKREIKGSKPLK